ncbi:putative sugar transporter [Xylariaceae sp. FL0804]|nr:putative sugar transporter [Xylariaceae sp. FL0804]
MRDLFPLGLRREREGDATSTTNTTTTGAVFGHRPYVLAFSAAWASALFGYDGAFIGATITLPSFRARYGLDVGGEARSAALSSDIVSVFQAGAFFGAVLAFLLAERFGRKPTIMLTGVVFIVGAVLQILGFGIGLLYGGRVLTGLAIGGSTTMLPLYIAECAPPLIRGRLVGITEVMIQIGLVVGFWINYGVARNISDASDAQWRIPFAVQFVPAGMLLISMPFLPESPRWLLAKNRVHKATRALAWVRDLPPDHALLARELDEIRGHVAREIETTTGGARGGLQMLRELAAPGVRNRVVIAVLLMLLQNLSGVNGINYYSPTILESIGFSGTDAALLATGIYGIVKCVSAVVFIVFFVDKLGRRPALVVGAAGAMVPMFYLAGYSELSGSFGGPAPPRDAGSTLTLLMIYLYAVFFGLSWNNIPWIFASEVLPSRVRTLGMMCAVCMQWLAQFLVVYSLPHMIRSITYGTFVFFGVCIVLSFIFAYLFVPETKGVALEDMDLLLGAGAPLFAPAARRRYDEARAAGLAALDLLQLDDADAQKKKKKSGAGGAEHVESA